MPGKKIIAVGIITVMAGMPLSFCEAATVYGADHYYEQYEESRIPEAEDVSGISAVTEEPETDESGDAVSKGETEGALDPEESQLQADGGEEDTAAAESEPEEMEAPEESDDSVPAGEMEMVPEEGGTAEEAVPEEEGQEEAAIPAEYLVTEDVSDLVMQKGAVLSEETLEEGGRILEGSARRY